jgi:hypothetical protein
VIFQGWLGSQQKTTKTRTTETTTTKLEEKMMEELMPELVEMVLSRVDRLGLVACSFVCTTWMRITATSPPRREADHRRQWQEEEDWSKQFAVKGWLALLQWARSNGCPWDEQACASAARRGHLGVLQWARANGCPWDEWTCADAAEGGHLAVLQWARTNGCLWDEWTCAEAAEGGHLAVLQWARQRLSLGHVDVFWCS